MSSRTLLNLALLILVGISALVMVYLPGLEKPTSPVMLAPLMSSEQVTRIQILRTGQADIHLTKEARNWVMTAPFTLPANAEAVDSLTKLTQTQSLERFTADKSELGKFKLAEPQVRLRLNDTEIAFGDTDALAQRRYLLIGNTVHLVNEQVYEKLNAAPTTWISTSLLPPGSKLRELGLPGLALVKQADGRWNSTPRADRVSMDAINTLADEWMHAQALQLKPYEAGTAQGKITVRLHSVEKPISFDIMARAPELILARPDLGIQYHFPAELAARLLKLTAPETTPQQDNASGHEATPHNH